MIPYVPYRWTVLEFWPFELHLFSVLVVVGVLVGTHRTCYRGRQLGFSNRETLSLASWVVAAGFWGAHILNLLAYQRRAFEGDAGDVLLRVINPFSGLASFGGFFGALVALLIWTRHRRKPVLACADALLYGLPFGWFFGRMGCFSVHEHLGVPTSFPLAVRFPAGPRHDLGLNEALFAACLALGFALLSRRPRVVGLYAALACVLYGPLRFGLDFLRTRDLLSSDPRYFGLTPAQYGSLVVFAVGVALVVRLRSQYAGSEKLWGNQDPNLKPAG